MATIVRLHSALLLLILCCFLFQIVQNHVQNMCEQNEGSKLVKFNPLGGGGHFVAPLSFVFLQ